MAAVAGPQYVYLDDHRLSAPSKGKGRGKSSGQGGDVQQGTQWVPKDLDAGRSCGLPKGNPKGKGKARGKEAPGPLIVKEKRLDIKLFLLDDLRYGPAHFPIAAFTNSTGRRSDKKVSGTTAEI